MATATGVSGAGPGPLHRLRGQWPLGLVALVVLVALALFALTRFQGAPGTAPAPETAEEDTAAKGVTFQQALDALRRYGVRPEAPVPTVDAFLATPAYFSVTGRVAPEAALEAPSLLFYLSEDSHEELSASIPRPLLRIDGGAGIEPAGTTVITDSEHHRTTAVRYSVADGSGQFLVTERTQLLEIAFADPDGTISPEGVLAWQLPITYATSYESPDVVLGTGGTPAPLPFQAGPALTWAAFVAIMAGMLTALSPCLIQLGAYYAATLAGVGTEGGAGGHQDIRAAQTHIVRTGLFFAGGFTLVYTVGGAAAGLVGQSLETLGLLNTWMRPIAVVAGTVIILLALRVAWNARAPLVCRLPMAPLFGRGRSTGSVSSALMGISFAGGCLACFSASVLPALLLYAGATGSVAYGAMLLLVFSLGISLPVMGLAFGASRIQPLLGWLQRSGPALGLASAAVMVAFGVIMITDQFHLVSGLIGKVIAL